MALVDVLRKGQDPEVDFLKEGVRWLVQELMEAEVSAQIGADRYARSDARTTQHNGYRTRPWDTRVGTLGLAIPKLRSGSYFPSWLDARTRGEQALIAVVAAAYVPGVGTRKVEALVQTLGMTGISKSEVSRLCAVLDAQVAAFRTRRLDAKYPYIWVDARYQHEREDHRVPSMAAVIAYGVRADGVREVLGLDSGLTEDVVGIFANGHAVLRLFGALLAEQNDEWLVAGHRYMSETSLRKLSMHAGEEDAPAQLEAKTA
jgi:transposase-like protein